MTQVPMIPSDQCVNTMAFTTEPQAYESQRKTLVNY